MISGYVFLKRIDHPISLEMLASFTIMVESVDRYALVIQAPIFGFFCCFFHNLCIQLFLPILIVLVMPSIIKGGAIVREHLLSNRLTRVGTCMLMWHEPQHPEWDNITTLIGAVS